MRVFSLAVALLATGALAQTANGPPSPPSATETQVTPAPPPPVGPVHADLTHWGVLFDIGIPDGLGLGVGWRPMSWLRVSGAGLYNVLGFGARAGVSVMPFEGGVTPTLNLEGGHFFSGDVTSIIKAAGLSLQPSQEQVLRSVSYDFANLQLGVEAGSPNKFMVFLRLGASYMRGTITNFGSVLANNSGYTAAIYAADPLITVVLPTLKIGFIAYF